MRVRCGRLLRLRRIRQKGRHRVGTLVEAAAGRHVHKISSDSASIRRTPRTGLRRTRASMHRFATLERGRERSGAASMGRLRGQPGPRVGAVDSARPVSTQPVARQWARLGRRRQDSARRAVRPGRWLRPALAATAAGLRLPAAGNPPRTWDCSSVRWLCSRPCTRRHGADSACATPAFRAMLDATAK